MNRNLRFFLLVLCLGSLSAASLLAWEFWPKPKDGIETNETTIQVDNRELTRQGRFVTSYAPVVKKVSQSVVNIFTTTTVREVSEISPFFNDPFFQQFFGQIQPRERTRQEKNLGSGVVVSKDGYIITNNHVVDRADEVRVSLFDSKKEYVAKLVGKDPKTDIAVLKIEALNLTPVLLGDSDQLQVGDVVLAIGNPFGIGQTVTMGIISALGRNDLNIEHYEDFIQTDAAINPGNSGGALVDADGRLIGINTAIFSQSGGNQGIGFAVPVNLARNIMERILKYGQVIRGFLGVGIQNVDSALAQSFNLPVEEGVIINEITPKSAAEEAGLQLKDVIIKIDGKVVKNEQQVRNTVGQKLPNTQVNLTIIRDGNEKIIEVTLKEEPGRGTMASQSVKPLGKNILEGIVIGELTSELKRQLQAPANLQGVIVMSLEESALAAQEDGLKRGDVIVEFDNQLVKNSNDLVRLSNAKKEGIVSMRIWRRGNMRFLTIKLS